MEELRRKKICSELEKLGYSQNADGKFHIHVPLRKLEKKELEKIFCDERGYNKYPKRIFHVLMKNMAKTELDVLTKCLSHLDVKQEELEELTEICIPVEEHLQQVYHCDIGVDTGDSRWEYTMNTLAPSYDGFLYGQRYRLYDGASIVWLTKQQGHTKKELAYALHWIDKKENGLQGYIRSAAYEAWHELSGVNQLYFLLDLTLEQIMLLQTAVEWRSYTKKWNGYVILSQDTRAGFFDPSSGSGSLMRIELERDVKLPMKYIASVIPDDATEYNVYSVYGNKHMWNQGKLKKITLPKKFRLEMEALGFEPWIKNR